MSNILQDLFNDVISLAETENNSMGLWREQPVGLVEFFTDFLGERPFPGKQTELLETVEKILDKDNLHDGQVKKELTERLNILQKDLEKDGAVFEDLPKIDLKDGERFEHLSKDKIKELEEQAQEFVSIAEQQKNVESFLKARQLVYNLPGEHKLKAITEVAAMFGKGCKHGSATITDVETGKVWTLKELAETDDRIIKVTAIDPVTQEVVIANASRPSKIGRAEMFKVITNTGHETIVTAEHVFMTRNSNSFRKGKWEGVSWKRLADLKVGDDIALSSLVKHNGKRFDFREMRLMGYWLGGSLSLNDNDTVYFGNHVIKNDCYDILSSYDTDPKHCKFVDRERESSIYNKIKEIVEKYDLVGVTSCNKRIPSQVFEADEESIIEFLRSLYATNGQVCNSNGGRSIKISYTSASKKLIYDLQELLRRLGIFSKVRKKKTKSDLGISYDLLINDNHYARKFCNKVKIIGKEPKQIECLKSVEGRKGKYEGKNHIIWATIKSIESIGEDDYYDLSVMCYGNYISDGFIDHNSGKDFLVSGIVAYIPYRLNCMNDPQGYFGFGRGENIDIINLAKNAKQAENVFFTKLKARLKSCKWFKKVDRPPETYNEYQEKKDTIIFYNNIRAFSGHSEAGSFEGFSPIVSIFDEVGDFEWNLADFAYRTLRSSAMSRYGNRALLLFISFPRSAEDFMMHKYRQGQDPEYPEVYSLIGKSWEVNLNIKREDLEMDYKTDPEGSKMKYECIPPAQKGGFFQYPERIDDCIKTGKYNCAVLEETVITLTLEDGQERHFVGYDLELFKETLELDHSKTYYMGLDGGIDSDMYTLSLFHAETFYEEVVEGGEAVLKPRNKPVEDLLIRWKPDTTYRIPVSVQNTIDIVEAICERVYVKKALMDKFNSGAMVQKLMEFGVEAEDKVFSNPFQVAIYTQLKNLAYTGQLELLDLDVEGSEKKDKPNDNLKHILLVNGNKIDHEKDREKDTCDARAAAIYLCATDDPVEETNFSMPVIVGTKRGR